MRTQRLAWLDGMRGLAILWIAFVHFVSIFTPNSQVIFPGIWRLLLFGISGKLAVAGCSVIMGYFASKPSAVPVWRYALRRYLTFAVQVFLIEGLFLLLTRIPALNGYALLCIPELNQPLSALLPGFAADVFLFKAQLIPTYWCVGDFVAGSILTFALSRLTGKMPLWGRMLVCAGAIAVLIALECTWLAICLMGWALRLLMECRIPFRGHPLFWIVLLAFVPWMIRRGECPRTYLLDGAASVLVLYVFAQWSWIQKVLCFRPLARLGTITLEFFMLHVPLFEIVRHLIRSVCELPLGVPEYAVMFAAMMALAVPAAIGWRKLCGIWTPKRA